MIISFSLLGITLGILFLLPAEVLLPVCTWAYGLLVLWRVFRRELVLMDLLVFGVYALLSFLHEVLGLKSVIPYMGTTFYFFISFGSIVGGLAGVPFTLYNPRSATPEDLRYHRVLSVAMGILYSGAFFSSWLLFPRPEYIWVPLVVVGVSTPLAILFAKKFGSIVTEFLQDSKVRFVSEPRILSKSFGNAKGMGRVHGRFACKEVVTPGDEAIYLDTLREGYREVYRNSGVKERMDYEQMWKEVEAEHLRFRAVSDCFVVMDTTTGQGVGTFRMVHSAPKLPLEACMPLTLDGLRRRGCRMGEAGRLSIVGVSGIDRGVVMNLLFHMLGPVVLTRGIHVVFTSALKWAVSTYERAGFMTHAKVVVDQEFLTEDRLCILPVQDDFSRKTSRLNDHRTPWASLLFLVYRGRLRFESTWMGRESFQRSDFSEGLLWLDLESPATTKAV